MLPGQNICAAIHERDQRWFFPAGKPYSVELFSDCIQRSAAVSTFKTWFEGFFLLKSCAITDETRTAVNLVPVGAHACGS